jgi:choline dehydrogenase-like flavoprotein
MFLVDLPPADRYAAVVVGAGPAGLSLATALAADDRRVLVLESGALAPQDRGGHSTGYGHFSGGYWDAHWLRALGGTTHAWTGWCPAPTPIDFDNPAIGVRWPIAHASLVPYWRRAATLLDHDPAFVGFEAPFVPEFVYRPAPTAAPVRFADRFAPQLRQSTTIDVALGHSVVELAATDARSALTALTVVRHDSGRRTTLSIAPRQAVILAGGGLGNAQLLQLPRADGAASVGNESGEVGRYLMEHPQFTLAGELVTDAELDRLWPSWNAGSGMHVLVAAPAFAAARGLQGAGIQCSRKTPDHDMARYLAQALGRPCFHYEITVRGEMRPSPHNRVVPTVERDAFGLPRLAVRCVLDAADLRSVETVLRLLGETLIRRGRGRVRVNNDRLFRDPVGQGHTLGTTRMGESSRTSVVDADCRVHGYANLYVAGSSVFPSGGFANPTLTIVALALRLADRLAAEGSRTS